MGWEKLFSGLKESTESVLKEEERKEKELKKIEEQELKKIAPRVYRVCKEFAKAIGGKFHGYKTAREMGITKPFFGPTVYYCTVAIRLYPKDSYISISNTTDDSLAIPSPAISISVKEFAEEKLAKALRENYLKSLSRS